MKNFDVNELLSGLEATTEKHLEMAVRVYQNLDAESLLKPAPDGGWSIAQCLEHLNTYGDYYLPKISGGITSGRALPSSRFNSTWLGNYFTKMLDPSTGKKKIKAFKAHSPARELDPYAVVAKFIQQQEELLQLMRRARATDLEKVKIPLSIAGFIKLRLGDVFRFIVAHNDRHMLQAGRLVPVEV